MLTRLRRAVDTMGGAWQLLLLWRAVRFRRHGAYLRWRRETAFGHDPARWPSARDRRAAMRRYGTWVARMKRIRRW